MYNNTIVAAEKFLPILDGIYKAGSRTAVLDTPAPLLNFTGTNKVSVFKTSLDGLGDYDRNAGYPTGSVISGWDAYTLTQDRGRAFMIDAMDNDETQMMAFGTLAAEFMRTKVTPEVDAYTFAKIASTSGISSANADITVGTTDVPTLIQTAETVMGDNEVPEEGKILFVSETAYAGLKAKITRMVMNGDGNIQNAVEMYDNMRVIRVPKGRFNTAITLYDGVSSGETGGGYAVPASTSYPINFMIVDPAAIVKVMKHTIPRIFSPEVNQSANAWRFDYRAYWDVFVLASKKSGIYMHRASTANS